MVRFNPKARLDTSRMQEAGGGGGGGGGGGFGGGGIGVPHIAGGGGVVGIIIAVIYFAIQVFGSSGGGLCTQPLSSARMGAAQGSSSADYSQCKTGDDANDSIPCALVAVEKYERVGVVDLDLDVVRVSHRCLTVGRWQHATCPSGEHTLLTHIKASSRRHLRFAHATLRAVKRVAGGRG